MVERKPSFFSQEERKNIELKSVEDKLLKLLSPNPEKATLVDPQDPNYKFLEPRQLAFVTEYLALLGIKDLSSLGRYLNRSPLDLINLANALKFSQDDTRVVLMCMHSRIRETTARKRAVRLRMQDY